MQNPNKRTFTLIELLLVIGIIIILAGIAIPNFAKAKERALTKEAIANLKLIAAAEKIWRIESADSTYTSCNCSTDAICNVSGGCNYLLKLNLTTQNWTYSVANVTPGTPGPPPTPPTFTATAVRKAGPYAGTDPCAFTLRHDDEDGEPDDNDKCP